MTSNPLREELVGLAWSLWSELGVSGWERRHRRWFVDPEPLIVFTAWLGDEDRRLRDEATDWCTRFGGWISATRLANLQEHASADTRARFGELAATVAHHSAVRWRGATKPGRFAPSGKSRLDSFDAPSRVSLRLRALFGVGARAEILRQFLRTPAVARSASELVGDAGFKKRNVADALDGLRLGGALDFTKAQNRLAYRLRNPSAWRAVVGELPEVWPRWTRILPLLAQTADAVARIRGLPPRASAVEYHKFLREIGRLTAGTESELTPTMDEKNTDVEALSTWVQKTSERLAKADARVFTSLAGP